MKKSIILFFIVGGFLSGCASPYTPDGTPKISEMSVRYHCMWAWEHTPWEMQQQTATAVGTIVGGLAGGAASAAITSENKPPKLHPWFKACMAKQGWSGDGT